MKRAKEQMELEKQKAQAELELERKKIAELQQMRIKEN